MNRRHCAALALALLAVALPHAAMAYPQEPMIEACRRANQTYTFDSTWQAYPTAKTWAREAFSRWNNRLDYDGTELVTVDESIAGNIRVTLDWNMTMLGQAPCVSTGGLIKINGNYVNDQTILKFTATHEMGHMLKLHHSGKYESAELMTPAMTPCQAEEDIVDTGLLSNDDVAYLNWVYSGAAYHQLQANYGFEQGTKYWNLHGGTWEHLATGGAGGPGRIRHKTSSASSYVSQKVRLAVGDDDERYRVVGHYKVAGTNHPGSVTMTLYRKQLEYADSPNGCNTTDGFEAYFNSVGVVSPAYVALATTGAEPTLGKTSWTRMESTWVDPANAEGYEFDLRIASHADDSAGTDQWVYLDNLRAEGCESCVS